MGIFGGAADRENFFGGNTTAGAGNNNRDVAGRIFVQPFKGTDSGYLNALGFGYAADYGKQKGTDLPNYITPGQAPVFSYNRGVSADGPQLRGSPQFDYYYKTFGLIGEYIDSKETVEYKSGSNDHNAFDDGFANLNTFISKENAWGIGLNWYLNTNLKMVFDFEQTKFRRGAANGPSTDERKNEDLFSARFQLSL